MQNKKTIMAFSALLILIFHLWINITNSHIEMYLKHICVIGVDLFFFVSAYSMAKIKKIEYKKFIIDRFIKVYLKFIIFALIGTLCFRWSISKFFKVILGLELLNKGGGSFLWFIPSIMLVYLTLPIYKMLDNKHPKITPLMAIITYLFGTIIASVYTSYDDLFILTNRIPIILIGYYFAKCDIFTYLNASKIRYIFTTTCFMVLGLVIPYMGYINHFNILWFKESFYILYIPLIIGLILSLNKVKNNKLSILIGSITLELYGVQMLFGFKIANSIFKYINIKLLSNLITITVLIIFAYLVHIIFNVLYKLKREE